MNARTDRSTEWYEDGFTAFMGGKKAADNPWSNHAGAVASNWWFAGGLDAQWEIVSKLRFSVKQPTVHLGAHTTGQRAIDVRKRGK